jgi:hypothetical protein
MKNHSEMLFTDFLIFGTKLLISSSLSFENGCLWVHVYDPKYISDNGTIQQLLDICINIKINISS